MLTTLLVLLVVLAAICIVLWVIGRAVVAWVRPRFLGMREATQPRPERSEPPPSSVPPHSLAWLPTPPGTTLLRVESVPISQAGNPAPMLRTGTITGTAGWYCTPLSYPDVAAWYAERLSTDGWQEEAGHGQLRVFRREHTLVWLADGEDAAVWQRLTNPRAASRPPPRGSEIPGGPPTFTILVYDTGAAASPPSPGMRGPFGGLGRI